MKKILTCNYYVWVVWCAFSLIVIIPIAFVVMFLLSLWDGIKDAYDEACDTCRTGLDWKAPFPRKNYEQVRKNARGEI